MVISISISVIGLVDFLCRCVISYVPSSRTHKHIDRQLTLREIDHLNFIKSKDIVVYIAIVREMGKVESGELEQVPLDRLNSFWSMKEMKSIEESQPIEQESDSQ